MNIAYTKNELTDLIISIDDNKINQNIIDKSQNEIEKNILNENIELALVDPLTYVNIKKKKDIRVIPFRPIFLEDYSEVFGLDIANTPSEQKKLLMPLENQYLFNITKIILSERYNINLNEISKDKGNKLSLFNSETMLDISEDWYESFKIRLPLYFWVALVKDEVYELTHFELIISSITKSDDTYVSTEDKTREGQIVRTWDAECENSLDNTLELLFYHNVVPEIHACKLYDMNDIIQERNDIEE